MFYFYIIQSVKDGSTYIGSTEDLKRRVKEHNEGKTKSIKYRLPYKLLYYEAYLTKRQARVRELEIKKSGRKREELYKRIV